MIGAFLQRSSTDSEMPGRGGAAPILVETRVGPSRSVPRTLLPKLLGAMPSELALLQLASVELSASDRQCER